MQGERLTTAEAAAVLGASTGWVREKMRLGQLPIGIYSKQGDRADPKIFLGMLAEYLRIDREELKQMILKMEGETDG